MPGPPALETTLATACVILRTAEVPIIALPGGAVLTPLLAVAGGDPGAILDSLLAQAGTALAPLAPIFKVLAALMSIKGVADAIPKLIGPPPDPLAFFAAVEDLALKITDVAKLLPQLTVPLMAKSVLDTVIAGLQGLKVKLQAMMAAQERTLAASQRASLLPNGPAKNALMQIADCATNNLATQLANENKAMGTLNQLIALLNTLIQLVPGVPCIPTLESTPSISQEAIDALDTVIGVLEGLSAIFPAPDAQLPALPAAGAAPC